MKIQVLEKLDFVDEPAEVVNLEFVIEELTITVNTLNGKFDIVFDSPVGFRVLDEGDLLEFWPDCSAPNGWFFKIVSGGWLEQESKREGFIIEKYTDIREYFIAGESYCVNVICTEPPELLESIR